jgi:hypothetical protein
MKTITSKKEIKLLCEKTLPFFSEKNPVLFVDELDKNFLKKKIKFPLLEMAARELFAFIPQNYHLKICNEIIELDTIGGNVIIGIVLQMRLKNYLAESFEKACQYINRGNEWYVCDIIAERVMGVALLTQPEEAIPLLKKLAASESNWVVRTVGVATHYAVKKGLKKNYVGQMFLLLLSLAGSADFHIKTGTGWGAKTCVKFYPDLAKKYKEEIESPEVKQWFRTKIKIGLGRSEKYSKRFAN